MGKSIFDRGKDEKKPVTPVVRTPAPDSAPELEPWEKELQDETPAAPAPIPTPEESIAATADKLGKVLDRKPKSDAAKPITKVPGPRRKFE
jgi:hypothetical protein